MGLYFAPDLALKLPQPLEAMLPRTPAAFCCKYGVTVGGALWKL